MPYYTRVYADIGELIGTGTSATELTETQFNAFKPIAESYLTKLVELNSIDQSSKQTQLNLLGDLVLALRVALMPGRTTTARTVEMNRITPAEINQYFGELMDAILVPEGWCTEEFDSWDSEQEV